MTTLVESTLLDEALPDYDVHELHSRELPVPPERAWDAIRAVKPLEVRLLAPLMAVRALPALLTRRNWLPIDLSRPVLEQMQRAGFVPLGERPGVEYALGVIGRFWSLTGNRPVPLESAEDFVAFDEPGFAKGAINFSLEPANGGTLVRTETRVAGTDAQASRLFRRYWRVIEPGSGLIRISLLNAIARRAS